MNKNYIINYKNIELISDKKITNSCNAILKNKSTNKIFYKGHISDKKFNGDGEMYDDNKIYKGKFKNNLFVSGICTVTNNGITQYIGEFKNGELLNGSDSKIKINELIYTGNVVNGIIEGYGKYTVRNVISYKGKFTNNKFNDTEGNINTKKKSFNYVGSFIDGKMEGYGTYMFDDMIYYEGQFKNNLFDGNGKFMSNQNDCTIIGNFVKGYCDDKMEILIDKLKFYIKTKNGIILSIIDFVYDGEIDKKSVLDVINSKYKRNIDFINDTIDLNSIITYDIFGNITRSFIHIKNQLIKIYNYFIDELINISNVLNEYIKNENNKKNEKDEKYEKDENNKKNEKDEKNEDSEYIFNEDNDEEDDYEYEEENENNNKNKRKLITSDDENEHDYKKRKLSTNKKKLINNDKCEKNTSENNEKYVLTFLNNKYEGNIVNNIMTGKGTLILNNSNGIININNIPLKINKYIGEFKNGLIDGTGTIEASGLCITGKFKTISNINNCLLDDFHIKIN